MSKQVASPTLRALGVDAYDMGWREWPDFIRFNPGARHRRRITSRILRGLQFHRLLDVGCGSGEFLRSVQAVLGDDVILEGGDLSPEVVANDARRFTAIRFHVLDIEHGRLPESYDMIVCSEVIEHLNDPRKAFGNLASMLSPGGHLLVTCPTGPVYATERHFGHTHHPTVAQLSSYAGAAGLESLRVICWGFPIYRILRWAQNINPDWALRHFASGSYTTVAKVVSTALYGLNFLNVPSPWGPQLFALFRRPR